MVQKGKISPSWSYVARQSGKFSVFHWAALITCAESLDSSRFIRRSRAARYTREIGFPLYQFVTLCSLQPPSAVMIHALDRPAFSRKNFTGFLFCVFMSPILINVLGQCQALTFIFSQALPPCK